MADNQAPVPPDATGGVRLNKILQKSTLYLLGNIVGRAIGFLAVPLYTRLLTPTQYGIVELIELSTQITAIAFGMQCIGQAMTRLYHDQHTADDRHRLISTSLITTALFSGAIAALAVAAAPLASRMLFHSDQYATLLQAAFVAMFLANFIEVVLVHELIHERAKFYLFYTLGSIVLSLGLNIYFLAYLDAGVYGFVLSKLVVTIGGAGFLAWRSIREVGLHFRRSYVPEFIRFGAPLVLSSVAFFSIHFSDHFFLSVWATLADVARYGLAYKFAFLISVLIGDSFAKTWSVTFYRYTGQQGWQAQFARVASYLMFVLCLAALALSVGSPELLRIMVPESFFPPPLLLPLLVLAYVFREIGDFFRDILLINKRTGMVGRIAVAGAIFNNVLNVALIPFYGMYGAALATLATWLAYMALCWTVANREHRLPLAIMPLLRILALAGAVYAASALLRTDSLVLQMLRDAAWVALFAGLALLVFFDKAERRVVITTTIDAASTMLARLRA